jgi:hypothetical protein
LEEIMHNFTAVHVENCLRTNACDNELRAQARHLLREGVEDANGILATNTTTATTSRALFNEMCDLAQKICFAIEMAVDDSWAKNGFALIGATTTEQRKKWAAAKRAEGFTIKYEDDLDNVGCTSLTFVMAEKP